MEEAAHAVFDMRCCGAFYLKEMQENEEPRKSPSCPSQLFPAFLNPPAFLIGRSCIAPQGHGQESVSICVPLWIPLRVHDWSVP